VRHGLNTGTLATANLVEAFVIDFPTLLHTVAPDLPAELRATVRQADGIVARMQAAGAALQAHFGTTGLSRFLTHPSDTVRGWAAYAIGAAPRLTIARRLAWIRPLADDPHFGVREWAWLAVRPAVAADLPRALSIVSRWTAEPSPYLRRFASEVTRPRGVWCAHIPQLKDDPELGRPILEPLRSDAAKYVRDSVANWLNDAAKTRPDWVRAVCDRWHRDSPTPQTRSVIERGLRSLRS
jgi:3-methyladenine DNA glycosylase AlkC